MNVIAKFPIRVDQDRFSLRSVSGKSLTVIQSVVCSTYSLVVRDESSETKMAISDVVLRDNIVKVYHYIGNHVMCVRPLPVSLYHSSRPDLRAGVGFKSCLCAFPSD